MILKLAILAALMQMPPYYLDTDEPKQQRRDRLETVAAAVAQSANTRPAGWEPCRIAAALLTLGWYESRFARFVGEGRCLDGPPGSRCDPDRNGKPRARTYFQIWKRACPDAWARPEGSPDELREAASCAARRFVGAYYRCAGGYAQQHQWGPLAGAFSGYRNISCTWEGALPRAATMSRFESMLRSYMQ